MAEPLGGKLARRISRQIECFGDRGSKQRVAERVQHQGQGAFGDVMCFVADRQLSHQRSDRIEDGVQGIAVAGDDHPGGEGAGALLAERIETLVDDHSRVRLAGPRALDRVGDIRRDRIRDRPRKLALKACSRAEMVEQIGMGSADLGRNGLERNRLWPLIDQQFARRRERGGAAFFRGQARPSY